MVVFPALCMCLVSGEDSSQSNCCSKCFLASRCVFCHFPCCACAVSHIQGSTSVVRSGGIWCCYFIADTEEVLPHKKQTHSCVTPALLQRDLCKVSGKSAFSFSFDCLGSEQLTLHFSPRYSWKYPTKRSWGCTVLFKSTIPRQVYQGGKLILM